MYKIFYVDDANNSSVFEMKTREQTVLTKRGSLSRHITETG